MYCAIFIDAIHVKVRDGQVANRPVYAAIGVTADGTAEDFRRAIAAARKLPAIEAIMTSAMAMLTSRRRA